MSDLSDRGRDDFLSESQEIIDRLSRSLLLLDATSRMGAPDPDLLNSIFREVHTLKGLSGLFNAARLTGLSHELEDLLDDLRMGRLELSADVLDILFRAVELYNGLLNEEKTGQNAPEGQAQIDLFMRELRRLRAPASVSSHHAITYNLDPGMLAVLTEYEEHRLRTCIASGLRLYRITVVFELLNIDDGLESLKAKLKPFGEILTYLPSGPGADADLIELEILMASSEHGDVLTSAIADTKASVEEVQRLDVGTEPPRTFDSVEPPSRDSLHPILPQRITLMPEAPPKTRPPPMALRQDGSIRSVAQTVRVDIGKLDHLMNLLGELAIVRGGLARAVEHVRSEPQLRELGRELGRLHHSFSRHLAAMQTGILEVRMVPLGTVFEKLARVARQASRELQKNVNLVITGAETEVDKIIGEELSDPLMHMIRNALDHGIEPVEQRVALGKPEIGTIALNAYQKGNQVVVEVEDDGAGVDHLRLLNAAVRGGILGEDEAAEMTRPEALNLIFMPGLTTRVGAGKMSGRGVGMDVVKTNIGKLGGVVDVHSELGIGAKFTVTMPITLAIISALMVRVADATYAVPLSSVQEALAVDASAVRVVEGRELVTVRGESLPICRLREVFRERERHSGSSKLVIVVATAAARRSGFVVDHIVGRQDIVIKALTGPLRKVSGFAGATELGDQHVGLVLDVPSLLEEALSGGPRMTSEVASG